MQRAVPLHELKTSSTSRSFHDQTHESIGHLQTLCMSVLLLKQWCLSLNGNASTHRSALEKRQRSSMKPPLQVMPYEMVTDALFLS